MSVMTGTTWLTPLCVILFKCSQTQCVFCLNLPVNCHDLSTVFQDCQPDSQKSCWLDPSPSRLEGPMGSSEASPSRVSVACRNDDPGKCWVPLFCFATWGRLRLCCSKEGQFMCVQPSQDTTHTCTYTHSIDVTVMRKIMYTKLSATVSFLSFRFPPAKMSEDLGQARHLYVDPS
jgi:hypothetical protein